VKITASSIKPLTTFLQLHLSLHLLAAKEELVDEDSAK
jgi:hypothetical protein